MRAAWLCASALALACVLAGCDRTQRDMLRQPRHGPEAASPLFADGRATRPPPPDAVPHAIGTYASASGGRTGTAPVAAREADEARQFLPDRPPRALLVRGQERYAIYCMPCHSSTGDGDGPVVERGFPRPPTLHSDALRRAADRHLYEVISHGRGLMYPMADRIEPADRWAIVAFVRALQLSRHAPIDRLPADLRQAVSAAPATRAPAPGAWRPAVEAPSQ
ncbi:MAG: cytochrome c [Variovorax sp.]|nr:cytochrome c [Variovorax sp.]